MDWARRGRRCPTQPGGVHCAENLLRRIESGELARVERPVWQVGDAEFGTQADSRCLGLDEVGERRRTDGHRHGGLTGLQGGAAGPHTGQLNHGARLGRSHRSARALATARAAVGWVCGEAADVRGEQGVCASGPRPLAERRPRGAAELIGTGHNHGDGVRQAGWNNKLADEQHSLLHAEWMHSCAEQPAQ